MKLELPSYYTSLPQFRALFQTGVPILMYHKLGRHPRGTRLKGLYLGAKAFARQLAELRGAGFACVGLSEVLGAARAGNRAFAITFDDGFRNTLEFGLAPLEQHRCRAVQFLVADLLGRTNEWERADGETAAPLMDAEAVREWLAAGHEIGSHTLRHPFLTRLPRREAREEIHASKRKLEDLFGVAVEHFCYPYGDWNLSVRDLVAQAGYRTASTVTFGVNSGEVGPLELRRIMARYRSRNWKTFRAWLAGRSAR
jgi:peptidoglycan/xylan/chitin deacetylase (PgdA/CDA1 family)